MDELNWFGDDPFSDPFSKPKKRRPKHENDYHQFEEYIEGSKLNMRFSAITYDDQIDFHNWLRDTPTEWIVQKLKEEK